MRYGWHSLVHFWLICAFQYWKVQGNEILSKGHNWWNWTTPELAQTFACFLALAFCWPCKARVLLAEDTDSYGTGGRVSCGLWSARAMMLPRKQTKGCASAHKCSLLHYTWTEFVTGMVRFLPFTFAQSKPENVYWKKTQVMSNSGVHYPATFSANFTAIIFERWKFGKYSGGTSSTGHRRHWQFFSTFSAGLATISIRLQLNLSTTNINVTKSSI